MSEETLNKQLAIVQEAMEKSAHLGDLVSNNDPFENIACRHLAIASADLKIRIDQAKKQKEANDAKADADEPEAEVAAD